MHTEYKTFNGKSYLVASIKCTGQKVSEYPMVFLGGAVMSVKSMEGLLSNFAKFVDVYAIDLPGFGDSDLLHDDIGLEFYRDLLLNFTLNKGFKKVNLVGSSYGSAPAMLFAFAHPHRVNRLVGIGTMPEVPKAWRKQFLHSMELVLDPNKKEEFAQCFAETVSNQHDVKYVNKGSVVFKSMKRMLAKLTPHERMAFKYNTCRLLKHKKPKLNALCNVRALLCTGEYDHFTTPDLVDEVADMFYSPDVCTIQNADHMVHIEQPKVFVDLVRAYLSGKGIRQVEGICENEMLAVA
ncbi:MAG: alpha/beta hydrolase [Saccharospirillaceae bacterium]|nr:alpha/beta hydrolase [Pseudomonadales bacterium]NRB78579.1 alpha/beta hydrolase [Saccharospirillaceae bacterium]